MDLLRFLFKRQQELLPALGVEVPDGDCLDDPMFWQVVIGLSTEAAEVLDAAAVANKPWKGATREQIHDQMKEELVDTLFMLLEVALFFKMTPDDIIEYYSAKYIKNCHRILDTLSEKVTLEQKMRAVQLIKDISHELDEHYSTKLQEDPPSPPSKECI